MWYNVLTEKKETLWRVITEVEGQMKKIERLLTADGQTPTNIPVTKRTEKEERIPFVYCRKLYAYIARKIIANELPPKSEAEYKEFSRRLTRKRQPIAIHPDTQMFNQRDVRALTYAELTEFLHTVKMSYADLFAILLPTTDSEWERIYSAQLNNSPQRYYRNATATDIPPMPLPLQPLPKSVVRLRNICDALNQERRTAVMEFAYELSPERWRSKTIETMPPSYRIRLYVIDRFTPNSRTQFMEPVSDPTHPNTFQWPESVGGNDFAKLIRDAHSVQIQFDRIPAIANLFQLPIHWIMMGDETTTYTAEKPQTELILNAYAFASKCGQEAILRYAECLQRRPRNGEK